jgi:hypothetical protein
MITKLERFGLGLILGPIAPLVGLLSLWWSAYALLPEKWIAFCALSGLFLGLLVDFIYLSRWINQSRRFGFAFWVAVYLFYSMGVFGFFMGVPVFNALLAIPAGFVVVEKLTSASADPQQVRRQARFTAGFTTGVLAVICLASALLALTDPYTSANLAGMFRLDFEITRGMLLFLILPGGAVLLAGNWWLTVSAIRVSMLLLRHKTV